MSENGGSPSGPSKPEEAPTEHLNIKVTDNNNEVFFKIKRTTQLSKLMNAFCERQGKAMSSVRFLFDGSRVNATDSPETVSFPLNASSLGFFLIRRLSDPTLYDLHHVLQTRLTDLAIVGYGRWRYSRGPSGANRRIQLDGRISRDSKQRRVFRCIVSGGGPWWQADERAALAMYGFPLRCDGIWLGRI